VIIDDEIDLARDVNRKYEHVITVQDCLVYIHIEWGTIYNTVDIVANSFYGAYSDSLKISQLTGCADQSLSTTRCPGNFMTAKSIFVPKIFDTIIFNDEIELLKLRLAFLKDTVDGII